MCTRVVYSSVCCSNRKLVHANANCSVLKVNNTLEHTHMCFCTGGHGGLVVKHELLNPATGLVSFK